MNQVNLNFRKNVNFKSYQEQQLQQDIQYQDLQEVQIPDMYYNPNGQHKNKNFKETIKDVDMMGLTTPWIEHPILMTGTCAGLAYGVDKFSKACSGDYEKSLVGKVAKFGDDIAESKVAKSKPVQSLLNWGKTGVSKFNNLTKNIDLINAIRYNPSRPELGLVKDELLNMEARIVHQFTTVAENLQLADNKPIKYVDIGLSKAEKDLIKRTFNIDSLSKIPQEKGVNFILLKRLGLEESKINNIINNSGATQATKDEILKAMGLSADDIINARKEPEKYVKKIYEAVGKVKGKVRVGAGEYSFLGPLQPFKRTIGCDELYNRFHSLGDGAKTKLGKALSRFVQKCHRGFTFGGGKLGVLLFVSPLLVETMIDAKKAEPNQKIGTIAHGLVEAVSWVFTFPLAISIMHHIGGAQYAGMTKEAIEEVRQIKEKFNNTKFASYKDYLAELATQKARVKELETVKNQSLFTKISRKLGKFMTIDLERFQSYKGGYSAGNLVRKTQGLFKNVAGVPMRLGIWGVLSMGVLGAAITKGTKLLFGNYYDRFKVEEQEAKKKQQKEFLHKDLQDRLLKAQVNKVIATQNNNSQNAGYMVFNPNNVNVQTENINNGETLVGQEALDNAVSEEKEIQTQEPVSEIKDINVTKKDAEKQNNVENNFSEIPEQEGFVKTKEDKYIPSQYSTISPENNNVENIDENKYIPDAKPVTKNAENKEEKPAKIDNYTYIPSSENVLKKNNKDENGAEKYIPSQLGAKFTKTFDNSGLSDALSRADRAERKAIQTLAGNFNRI